MNRITDCPDMILAKNHGSKASNQSINQSKKLRSVNRFSSLKCHFILCIKFYNLSLVFN